MIALTKCDLADATTGSTWSRRRSASWSPDVPGRGADRPHQRRTPARDRRAAGRARRRGGRRPAVARRAGHGGPSAWRSTARSPSPGTAPSSPAPSPAATAAVGDELSDRAGRRRRPQSAACRTTTAPVEEVHRGQRAAINLAGVHHDEIRRGQELASPGHLVPSTLLTVRLDLLPAAPRPLKNRSRSRARRHGRADGHRSRCCDRDRLEPGRSVRALFLSSRPWPPGCSRL